MQTVSSVSAVSVVSANSADTVLRQIKLTLATTAMLVAGSAGAQTSGSIEDNIRPVGQVCLVGQACAGRSAVVNTSDTPAPVVSDSAPAVSTPAPAVSTPAPAAATPAPAVSTPAPVVAAPVTAPEPVAPDLVEPVAAAAQSDFDAAAAYQQYCFACHASGVAGAPETGDADAWDQRMEKGMDAVMVNVINGLNAMPPKGICMTCSDGDLQQIVEYMVSQ